VGGNEQISSYIYVCIYLFNKSFFIIFKTSVVCRYRMSDASDEAEMDDENENVEPPPLPPFLLPLTRTVVDQRRNAWGRCSTSVRAVGSETSDTTGSSSYNPEANRRRRKAQDIERERRWLAFAMSLHKRLAEKSLWKLPGDLTRTILEKTLKRK
jgi:hypothetical protein